jgi:hypothetical protein
MEELELRGLRYIPESRIDLFFNLFNELAAYTVRKFGMSAKVPSSMTRK